MNAVLRKYRRVATRVLLLLTSAALTLALGVALAALSVETRGLEWANWGTVAGLLVGLVAAIMVVQGARAAQRALEELALSVYARVTAWAEEGGR